MMSYLNKVLMAASAAAAQSHSDQGIKLNAGLRSLVYRAKDRIVSSSSSSSPSSVGVGVQVGLAPAAGAAMARCTAAAAGGAGGAEEDSFRKALYISSWGPS